MVYSLYYYCLKKEKKDQRKLEQKIEMEIENYRIMSTLSTSVSQNGYANKSIVTLG